MEVGKKMTLSLNAVLFRSVPIERVFSGKYARSNSHSPENIPHAGEGVGSPWVGGFDFLDGELE